MWSDNDSPGCVYDTIDCTDCGACNPSPLASYFKWRSQESDSTTEDATQNSLEGERL